MNTKLTKMRARNRPNRQLSVCPVPLGVSFAGSAEECRSADFRSEDRREHGPPRDLTITEGKPFDTAAPGTLREPDRNDGAEVTEQNQRIEEE
jgi:hypothetical protein